MMTGGEGRTPVPDTGGEDAFEVSQICSDPRFAVGHPGIDTITERSAHDVDVSNERVDRGTLGPSACVLESDFFP